jgi:hypothetical protein
VSLKTIKQLADEIGVSKQAVFYRIKKPPLSNTLQSLTSKLDGVLMVSFDGEKLIKQAFHSETVKTFDDKEPSKEKSSFDGSFDGKIIELLQENIEILRSQLEVKDRQILELTATVKMQAQSINADRNNELAGTIIESQQKFLSKKEGKARKWMFWK